MSVHKSTTENKCHDDVHKMCLPFLKCDFVTSLVRSSTQQGVVLMQHASMVVFGSVATSVQT